ncbi:hypothetical protein GCM10010307_63640 [Streptomyces vastus]|uniref:Uncharacterized protein n=1 Tax=Streptomyces vastus TaxID=285451 RepID=A0ABN3RJW7_9ACTN
MRQAWPSDGAGSGGRPGSDEPGLVAGFRAFAPVFQVIRRLSVQSVRAAVFAEPAGGFAASADRAQSAGGLHFLGRTARRR